MIKLVVSHLVVNDIKVTHLIPVSVGAERFGVFSLGELGVVVDGGQLLDLCRPVFVLASSAIRHRFRVRFHVCLHILVFSFSELLRLFRFNTEGPLSCILVLFFFLCELFWAV